MIENFAKILCAIVFPVLFEILLEYGLDTDTKNQIDMAGAFTPDSRTAATLIMKRKEKIVTCFLLCYSIFASSLLFLAKNPGSSLGIIGVGLGIVFIILTLLFKERIPYNYFDENKARSYGNHWKSVLTFPMRIIIYIFNFIFIFSA